MLRPIQISQPLLSVDVEPPGSERYVSKIAAGRACIARSHRNSRVLLKLWQGLLKVMRSTGRQYLFGCSSIFTRDVAVGKATFEWLVARGHVETNYSVKPANSSVAIDLNVADDANVVVPPLLDMYLRCGARICSPPIYDSAFGTVDMLIVFDINAMSDRQRRLFERG